MAKYQPHPASLDEEALYRQCEVRRLRRSGPGGQHRNKVETAIALSHTPTGTTAEASERRSQAENRAAALFRLRVNLALEVRRPVDLTDPPSVLWQSRVRGGRIAISESHADFPVLLAEALDRICIIRGDARRAAGRLGLSSSQLVNQWREANEMPPLR